MFGEKSYYESGVRSSVFDSADSQLAGEIHLGQFNHSLKGWTTVWVLMASERHGTQETHPTLDRMFPSQEGHFSSSVELFH